MDECVSFPVLKSCRSSCSHPYLILLGNVRIKFLYLPCLGYDPPTASILLPSKSYSCPYSVSILQLREELNCIQSQAESYEDPTLLVGSDADKELGRALKTMGAPWVAEVCNTI